MHITTYVFGINFAPSCIISLIPDDTPGNVRYVIPKLFSLILHSLVINYRKLSFSNSILISLFNERYLIINLHYKTLSFIYFKILLSNSNVWLNVIFSNNDI